MKTKEELNALKKEVEEINKKLAELTEEELAQVTGGSMPHIPGLPIGQVKGDGDFKEYDEYVLKISGGVLPGGGIVAFPSPKVGE